MPARRGQRIPMWVWCLWAIAISGLLLIGLPILGGHVGLDLFSARRNAGVGRWRSLGAPPERPTAIVDADLDRVYVRGQDGSLYECDRNGPTQDDACWVQVEQPRERDSSVEHGNSYRGKLPSSPGPVTEALDVSRHFAERAWYARYVLLEDGSVWVWAYNADANTSLLLLFTGPICGLALAIVLVLLIWLALGVWGLLRGRKASE